MKTGYQTTLILMRPTSWVDATSPRPRFGAVGEDVAPGSLGEMTP
jgi:hypothetical protein